MPGLLRKLLIIAAVDGLILQPHGHNNTNNKNNNNGESPLRIDYKTNKITAIPTSTEASEREKKDKDTGIEVYGLVGKPSAASRQSDRQAGMLT